MHNGVLFLDELPEFRSDVLEVLRQPLEDGQVTVSRVSGTVTFPQPLHAGVRDESVQMRMVRAPSGRCRCTANDVRRYHSHISGPLLDRIDLIVEVPALEYDELKRKAPAESSAEIKKRVDAAPGNTARAVCSQGAARRSATRTFRRVCCARCAPCRQGERLCTRPLTPCIFPRAAMTASCASRAPSPTSPRVRASSEHIAEAIQYRTYDFTEN